MLASKPGVDLFDARTYIVEGEIKIPHIVFRQRHTYHGTFIYTSTNKYINSIRNNSI